MILDTASHSNISFFLCICCIYFTPVTGTLMVKKKSFLKTTHGKLTLTETWAQAVEFVAAGKNMNSICWTRNQLILVWFFFTDVANTNIWLIIYGFSNSKSYCKEKKNLSFQYCVIFISRKIQRSIFVDIACTNIWNWIAWFQCWIFKCW